MENRKLNFFTDKCLCGSNLLIKDCCLTRVVDTSPPGPKTNYSHPRCYARSLNDCSKQLSKEHYISKSILELNNESRFLEVSGFPWQKSENLTPVSIKDLASNVMCARHNSALSSLDSLALTVFDFLTINSANEDFKFLNGNEFERWFLKLLCGLFSSGNVLINNKKFKGWQPPSEWLHVLFKQKPIAEDSGLFWITGQWKANSKSMLLIPVMSSENQSPIALVFGYAGFGFLFSMVQPPPRDKPSIYNTETNHRPSIVQLRRSNSTSVRELHTNWKNGSMIVLEQT